MDPDRGGVLADLLPPVIHVDASSAEASTIRWLLDQLVNEVTTNRPGVGLASKQLAQLLFVQIIRFYLASSNTVTTGWLRALNDERIAPALRLMHGEPSRAWRLSELAKHVGNGYGLHDVAGNVWEWVSDWYRPDYYAHLASLGTVARNPQGPDTPFDPSEPTEKKRVHRGGSFLCTDQYCSRYMVGTRAKGEGSTDTNHVGFRLVKTPRI